MLTIRRDPVPGMRAKLTARFEPSAATNESDPSGWSEPIAFSAMADSSGTVIQRTADHAGLIRRRRQHGARAVDQNGRNAGPAAEIAHDLRHPVEIDAGDNDGILAGGDGRYRIGRHHDRQLGGLANRKSLKTKPRVSTAFLK